MFSYSASWSFCSFYCDFSVNRHRLVIWSLFIISFIQISQYTNCFQEATRRMRTEYFIVGVSEISFLCVGPSPLPYHGQCSFHHWLFHHSTQQCSVKVFSAGEGSRRKIIVLIIHGSFSPHKAKPVVKQISILTVFYSKHSVCVVTHQNFEVH